MQKKPGDIRKLRRLKRRMLIAIISVVCFTTGMLCAMIALFLKRPEIVRPVPVAYSKNQPAGMSEDTVHINEVKKLLNEENISYESVAIGSNDTVRVLLKDSGAEVLLSTDKSLSSQIQSLQLTLNHFTIEGKKFSRIDFRFEKPVITFKE